LDINFTFYSICVFADLPTSHAVSVFAVWMPWLGSLNSSPPPATTTQSLNFECWFHVSTFGTKLPSCYLLFCFMLCRKYGKCPFLQKSFRGTIHWLIRIYFTLIIFKLTESLNLSFGISSPIN